MFNTKNLKYFFIICSLVAILYPLINIYYIFPSFSEILISNTEDEAIRVAKHLSSMVMKDEHSFANTEDMAQSVRKIKNEFKLEKIKVFSTSGEAIHSTDKKDIGKRNLKPYFHNIVAKGNPYTKVVHKDTKTLEDQVTTVDVVETYVPIMNKDQFVGAFEIYFDITQRNAALNAKVFNSSMVSFILMFVFFIAIVFLITRTEKHADTDINHQSSSSYQSAFYLLMVMIISIFIAEAVIMFLITKLPPMSSMTIAIADSALLVMVVSPVLFHFLFRPLILHIERRKLAEKELIKAHDKLAVSNKQLKFEIDERKKIEERLKSISITDELTNLYNRRGFFTLLEQQLKVVKRENKRVFILYADIDKFKHINDKLGHETGDAVLIDTAHIFKETFRDSDIISRMGGDEFVVFPIGNSEADVNIMIARLQNNIDKYNNCRDNAYKLSISLGTACYDPDNHAQSIETVLAKADKNMYIQKKNKNMVLG